MNGKARILAAAVVAMFCLTAFAVAEHSDDSAAVDQETYHMYVEFVDGRLNVTHGDWIEFTCDCFPSPYAWSANYALKELVKDFEDIGDVEDYGVVTNCGGITFTYDSTVDGFWPSVYCVESGSWTPLVNVYQFFESDGVCVLFHPAKIDGRVSYLDPEQTGPFQFNTPVLPDGQTVDDYVKDCRGNYSLKPQMEPNCAYGPIPPIHPPHSAAVVGLPCCAEIPVVELPCCAEIPVVELPCCAEIQLTTWIPPPAVGLPCCTEKPPIAAWMPPPEPPSKPIPMPLPIFPPISIPWLFLV